MLSVVMSIGLAVASFQNGAKTDSQNPGDLKIVSAIFGAKEGSIDVTPIVADMVRPGLPEFYATPKWLRFDPARYVHKELAIVYEYRGERKYFSVPEEGAVSYAILKDEAQPTTSASGAPDARGGMRIVVAYFGVGGTFVEVTNTVAQRVYPGAGEFVANASSMRVDPLPNLTKDLIITYEFEGKRRNFFTPNDSKHIVSYELLAENARTNGMATTHSNFLPDWVITAHPVSIAEAGAFATPSTVLTATERLAQQNAYNPDPRAPGHAPHIEAAIRALLSAQQMLQNDPLNEAMTDIQKALTNARATIAYVYPPQDQQPGLPGNPVVASSNPEHFEAILASLNTALNEFKQASPGGKAQFLPDAMTQTRLAIADVTTRH